ncbi:MAG TPA: hypothetical protein VEL28_11775 [Candidatus Binatia bacterium]|nr:hypothetical protein [Candidatus Binatia bacterium]
MYARVFAALAAAVFLFAAQADAQQHTCVLTISLTDDVEVNNLDFSVGYGSADGEIEGIGNDADCVRAVAGSGIMAVNDKDDLKRLEVALVLVNRFSGPRRLLGCRFFWDSAPPTAGEFSVVVSNAGVDGQDDNVRPLPKVKVTEVECPGVLPLPTTTTSTSTTTTIEPADTCGVVVSGGETPKASDALAALSAAVFIGTCQLCICDVDDNGLVTATDALAILRAAVGSPSNLGCPPCV